MTTPTPTRVGDLQCHTDARGQTQCAVEGNGSHSAPCVDGQAQRWLAPGDAVDGHSAVVAETFTDGAQSWARLTNGAVVPICAGTAPSGATQVRGARQGVSVGQVQMPQDSAPAPAPPSPEQPAQAVTPEQVCPPGWTMSSDGTCVPPAAIATPDPACEPGQYLMEDGSCRWMDFDPAAPTAPEGETLLPQMPPDMPPGATPSPGAQFDAAAKKLRAPGTMFDGMDLQPYGHGMCPENYNGGKRAVFFTLGSSKLFATVADDHGQCCTGCAVGGACDKRPGGVESNPSDHVPRGSVRMRLGTPSPLHTKTVRRDRTTKILVAEDGYMLSLQPLQSPLATFADSYGRTVYVGKRMWTAPGYTAPRPPSTPAGSMNVVQKGVRVPAIKPLILREPRKGPMQ